MKYQEIKELFRKHEDSYPKTHLTAYVTFSSFGPENDKTYPWESRTYVISSDNKAFQAGMGGYSIFGSCLDGTDRCLRLDGLMTEERGGRDGWVVEDCCIVGYLLIEARDMCIPTPQMLYTLDEAQDQMLARMADYAQIDPLTLKASYTEKGCRIVEDQYSAEKYNAWAGTGAEGELWEIKPVCIYDALHIEFDHERRSE